MTRRALGAQPERLADDLRLAPLRPRAGHPCHAVAWRDVRERGHAALDGAPLRVLRALSGHAAMVFGDHAEHRAREPTRAPCRYAPRRVDGQNRPACLLDALDDLALARRASGRAGRSRRRRPRRPASPRRARPPGADRADVRAAHRRRRSSPRASSTSSSSSRAHACSIRSACSIGETGSSPSARDAHDAHRTTKGGSRGRGRQARTGFRAHERQRRHRAPLGSSAAEPSYCIFTLRTTRRAARHRRAASATSTASSSAPARSCSASRPTARAHT